MRTSPPPPPPRDDLRFSNTTGIPQKKTMWFIGVEVEQETSAPSSLRNYISLYLLEQIAIQPSFL